MTSIRAVLFDLDGTLLDTAADLIFALNRLREEHDLPALDAAIIKPLAGLGSKFMIKQAFNIDDKDPAYPSLRKQFLAFYQQHLADSTQFFPQVEQPFFFRLDQREHFIGELLPNKLTHDILWQSLTARTQSQSQTGLCDLWRFSGHHQTRSGTHSLCMPIA